MATDRLLDLLNQFDTQQIERVFGGEAALQPPDPSLTLAPVKRVAIIAEAFLPKVDGVSKTAFMTMHYLRQTGREVLIFAPDIAPDHLGDTPIVRVPSLSVPRVPETRMGLPNPFLTHKLEAFQPDLIHLFSPAVMSVSGMAVGRHLGVPIVANYQTDLPGYTEAYGVPFMKPMMWNWLRYIHNGCHLTLAPSNHTIDELRDQGFKRLRRWGRGVDSARFSPAHRSQNWRERLLAGRDPDSLLCVYVGRLAAEKRVDLLLDVARLPGVALTIIGDGSEREQLESLFAGTNAHFMGYLFGPDLPAAFASADVFLFTGPNETFGQVVQESMASGLPSVVIDQGGVRDLVDDGISGFVCEGTPAAFAERVRWLRDHPQARQQMAHTARQMAAGRPWERVLSQLEDHYAEAVALNQRFQRIFGTTDYHHMSRMASLLLAG